MEKESFWTRIYRLGSIVGRILRWDRLVLAGLVVYIVLAFLQGSLAGPALLVDYSAVATLAGLIAGATMVEASGLLHWLATGIARRAPRGLALPIVLLVGGIVSGLTLNDAAVLVVAPLAVATARALGGNTAWALVLALASVNLGSSITPYGNPQGLIVYHYYGLSWKVYMSFSVPAFLPPLLLVSALGFFVGGRGRKGGPGVGVYWRTAFLGLVSIGVAVTAGLGGWPLVAAGFPIFFLAVSGLLRLYNLRALLLVWLAYADARAIGSLLRIGSPTGPVETYLYSVVLSLVVSNVPSTVLLLGSPWRPLLLGADIAGLVHPWSSIANLLGLRITGISMREYGWRSALLGGILVLVYLVLSFIFFGKT